MGSQCCRCANGKKQQITDYNSENINIRFHGKHELSTLRYQIQTYGNAPNPRSKLSRIQGIFYHSPIVENFPHNDPLTDNVRREHYRRAQMNIQNISIERQDGEPPVFIRRFTDLVAKVGTRIRFLVEIQSSPCPKVTWHRDHKEIDVAESRFSLVHEGNFYCIDIAQVRIEDEGYWTCLAENLYGRSSCTACLSVIIPRAYKKPQFIEELCALLTETGTVSLECKVVGIPTPVLKWFKDDKEIKAGDVFALTASPHDETSLGTYTCEAINCMGTAHSSSKIHVRDGDNKEYCKKSLGSLPVFKKILKDESCKIGDDLSLSCQIIVPPWPKDVTWYNKVGRIKPNEKYNIREDGLGTYSIEIKSLEAVDEGEWKCVATSLDNAKQFTTCYISMIIPKNYRIPRFMEGLKAVLTEEGLVSFECKVVGFPTPVLKWFKDGQELKPGDVYQLTGKNSLGLYCCIANNCMGEAKSTAELTIEDIEQQLNEEERLQLSKESSQVPKFIRGLKSCESMINENFTFTIQLNVLLSSEPSVSWYRNDQHIVENIKYKLIKESLDTFHIEIKKLELIDQAEWKCVAENDFGHSVTSCFLKLIIPNHFKKPKFLENLKAVFSKEGTVNLECKVIGVPQPVLKWYKDGTELKPGDIHRIISGENGTCCLGIYTCEATNCMGSVSSSASLLGFEDANANKESSKENLSLEEVARNLSLSTIHEERTSQLYDTPQTEHSLSLDDRGEVSFSFDGKEVSVSLYETPDLTEEDAIKIIEMYADQLSEHISESNVVELPPMRFVKETSTTGNLLMEAIVIDISPDYFIANEYVDDLCTEIDVEDVSIMDDQTQSIMSSYSSAIGEKPPQKPQRKKQSENGSSKSEQSEKNQQKSTPTLDLSESYYSAKELSSVQDHSLDILPSAIHTNDPSLIDNKQIINADTIANEPDSIQVIQSSTLNNNNNINNNNNNILTHNSESLFAIESKIDETTSELINYPKYSQIIEDELSTVEEESILYESPGIIENTSIVLSKIHFALSSALEKISMSDSSVLTHNIHSQNEAVEDIESLACNLLSVVESLRQCVGDITVTLADPIFSHTSMSEYPSNPLSDKLVDLKVPLRHMKEMMSNQKHNKEFQYILDNVSSPMQELKEAIMNLSEEICIEPEVIQLLEDVMGNIFAITARDSYQETEFPIDESFTALNNINIVPFNESDSESLISDLSNLKIIDTEKYTTLKNKIDDTKIDSSLEVKDEDTPETAASLKQRRESEIVLNLKRSEQLNVWTLTLIEPLNRTANIGLSLDKSIDEQVHTLLCKSLHSLDKQIDLMASEINHPQGQSLDTDVETIIEGFLWPANQLQNAIELAADIWRETPPNSSVRENLGEFANSISDLCEQLISLRKKLIQGAPESSLQIQKADASLIETITAVLGPFQNIQNIIMLTLNNLTIEKYEAADSMTATSKKLEDIQNDNENLHCENIIETDKTATNSELSLVENLEDSQNKFELQAEKFNILETITGETEGGELLTVSPERISAIPAPNNEISSDEENLKLLKGDATTSITDQTNENNNSIDRVDNIGCSASLDREKDVTSHEKEVSLEDNIVNIIKDELHRQSALELATINLFECIEAKVHLIMSINADMNEPSIFEEMVRDMTVEELQKTKLADNENTDGVMKNESLPGESSVDISKMNEEYNMRKAENLAEIQPPESDTRVNLSDSVESAKCSTAVEIEDLCENELLNDILTAESINNQEEIEEKIKKALAAEEVSSDNTIEHEVEVLVLSELSHTFANSIDIEEYREIIKSKCQATILNCPLASEHSISEESMGDLITMELEKQRADITQFYSHDEMKNIRATQTCIDITLEEVIKSLVTAELENSFAKMIEEQQYTDPIKSNVQLTILNNPKFTQEHISEEHIEELIITELEKQKLAVIEAEAHVSLIDKVAIKESNAHKTPMILKSPRDMEVTVPWEISNENTADEPEVSHQSVIVNLVNDDFASAAKNKKLILHCPQLLDEEVLDEPIEKIQSCIQEYNADTANVHVVEDDKFEVKAEPSQLILVKAQQLEEYMTDETIEGIERNEKIKYDKETANVNSVDDNDHKIETSQPIVIDPASYCSVDDSEKNSIVQIEEKPMISEKSEKSETLKMDPSSDNEFVREDDILAVTDLLTDSSIEHPDTSKLVMRETNIADSESIESSKVNQADIDDNRSSTSSPKLQAEISSGENVPLVVEEKSIAVATEESLLSQKLSKESIQDIVKIEIHNATAEECFFKDIDIDLITKDIQERLTTIPKEFDANDLEEHARGMVREQLIKVKMENEKETREKLRKKSTRKSQKNKKENSSDKDDNESKTEMIDIETINDEQNEILIKKQQEQNYSKEITDAKDNIEKQKEVEKMPDKEENHQVFDVEASSHEKITVLKEDNIEERRKVEEIRYKEKNDQSLDIETLSPEKITALKEDNIEQKKVGKIADKEEKDQVFDVETPSHEKITVLKEDNVEEQRRVEEIRYKEEKDQVFDVETPSHKKITVLKEDNVEKQRKVEGICYKEEKDQSLDIETLSHGKTTALKDHHIEEQKKVGKITDKEENHQVSDVETSSHEKITVLEEDNVEEQRKVEEICYKEERDQSLDIKTPSHEKITALNEDNIEEQKKLEEILYKEENVGAADIEMSSHEKITALKEGAIEERRQVQDTCYKEKTHESQNIESSSHEEITPLEGDSIEEQKKVDEIPYKEENFGAVDIETSSHEKITALKKNAIKEREKVKEIRDKEANNRSLDDKTPSDEKITGPKEDIIEDQKEVKEIRYEKQQSLVAAPSGQEKITALKEDAIEEQKKVKDIRDKEENHRPLDVKTAGHEKITALKEDAIEEQKKVKDICDKDENHRVFDTETSSQEKNAALKEDEAVNLSIEGKHMNFEEKKQSEDTPMKHLGEQEIKLNDRDLTSQSLSSQCANKLLEQEKPEHVVKEYCADVNIENRQIEEKQNIFELEKDGARKLSERYEKRVVDDGKLDKMKLEKDYDNDMSLECSQNSEAVEEIHTQGFEKISWNKEAHVQSDSDSVSLKFNEKLRTSNERDLSANLPSISIGCDESLASDHSRYSDELHTRSRIYHPFDNEGGIASLSDYSSTRGLTTSGPRDSAKKPVFCMKLTNRNAITASRIKLTCTVLGEPEPDIIWLRNNKELEESSNRYCITNDNGIVSLEIYSLKIEDSGEYSCIATNIHGRACTEAKLKVFAGYESTPSVPIFTRAIRDKFKVNENKLILECNVKAQPPPIITWLKDEKIIRMDNRYKQSDLSDGMCRLEISNPCSDDNGMYICRAENESGFSHSTSHLIYCSNKVENYRERDTTSFRSGSINYDGTRTERFTNRPYFSSYLTNHAVPAGGTIGLQVQVESASTPEVTWLRNDTRTPIFAPKAQSFSDRNIHTLILPNASESESGTYICRASNAYGYVDSAARVEIVSRNLGEDGKPAIFISRPVDKLIHAYIGEDVSLSFRTTGVPKPRVILMKGLTDITNGARAYKESHDDYVRITFKRVQISDEGTYCILVKNRYGCDRSFFTIRIKQRARSLTPSTEWNTENMENFLSYIQDANQSSFSKKVPGAISSKPVVIDGGKTWLALTWGKAEPQVTAPVTAYRVDAWLLGGDGGARWIELGITPTNSFDAFNLRPGGEYKFRVTPRNRYGWGESVIMENSVRIEETTAFPEFSKILPGQLKVLKGATLNLSCEINSDSTTHIRWYKDSGEINTSEDSRFITNRNDSKCTLSIKNIEENDSGRYVCDATNSAGRVSTFARVQVVTDPKIVEADMNFRKMRFMDVLNDDRPPEFTMRLRDRRVQTTFPVRLTCQVSGYPEPQITWYKSEEEIDSQVENVTISKDEAHFHTLEINRAKIDDTGIYMASAENLYGSVSCRCHLVVDEGIRAYIAPEFSQHLNEVYIVNHNEELRMNAQVKAYPAVGITWYRDGKHLRPGRNTVMSLNHDGTIELTLAHMTHGDAGLYCCVAINEVGRAESITKVQISTNFENINSTLECLPEIAEASAIPYSKAPVFITKPLSTEAFEGDNIIIMCEVIGDPKPEVIWLRDFLRPDYYKDSPHFRRIGLGPQYRLEIPYAKLDFTGTYSVIAKNSYGEAKAVISLQIYARDPDEHKALAGPNIKHGEILTIPVLKNSLKDIRCCDEDAITFSCKIHAIPAPNIRWERAGKLVGLGGDITTDFDGEVARLQIEHVYPEDEGEYTCIAYNSLGNTRTSACLIVDVPEGKEVSLNRRLKKPTSLHSLSLTPISTPRLSPVQSLAPSCLKHELRSTLDGLYTQRRGYRGKIPTSPKFYVVPHNRVVEEGDTVRFQCAVAGHPMPWAHWDKDGIAIMSNARITITEKNDLKILEIVEIIYDDAGLYRITLENEIGRVQATARLEVIRGRYSLLSRATIKRSSPEIHSAHHPSRHQYPSSSLRTSSSSILDEEYMRERAVSPIFLHKPSHHRSVNF